MRIGIDLGGSKIEGILLDNDGAQLRRIRRATPQGDYNATVHTIAEIVHELSRDTTAPPSVGIGIPGTLSPDSGLVRNANSTCLNGKPLKKDIANAIARPVRIANDANCFTASEAHDGAAAGANTVFGVILGTGVGGGIAFDGNVRQGVNAIAGEWGHNPLPWPQVLDAHDERPGPQCYCGKCGCIETFLSGSGLAHDHALHTNETLNAREIAQRCAAGEANATSSIARYEHRLARALASVVNVLDPDVIVLGGGLSAIARLDDNVAALWGRWVFCDHVKTRLVRNMHGDSSGVRGAAWLWDR